jgi:hypothetical protein
MRPYHFAQRLERAHRAFLGAEKGRVDAAVGIVHGDDQIPPLPRHPFVARAILVQHHADHGTACALATMRALRGRAAHAAIGLKHAFGPRITQPEPVIGNQLLVKVLYRKIPIAGCIKLQHTAHQINRRAPLRDPAQTRVGKPSRPFILVPLTPAVKRTD